MTIQEAQQLVEVWENKHATTTPGSRPSDGVLAGMRTSAPSGTVNGPNSVAPPATGPAERPEPDLPTKKRIGEDFWALLNRANRTGTDLTEALSETLKRKNGEIRTSSHK